MNPQSNAPVVLPEAQNKMQAQMQQGQAVMQDPAVQQAQMAAQAQQGLGTPPPAPYEYRPNPSMDLMNAHVSDQIQKLAESKQQQAMALKAKAQEAGGYAGYKSDPSAGMANGVGSDVAGHPNAGWSPSSAEAHQLNINIADRIKSGQMDAQTAQLAIQHPEVAPEIKQALAQIIQQAQAGGSPSEPQSYGQSQGGGSGLGSVPLPQ